MELWYKTRTMDNSYLKITVTILLAVIGWVVGHYFTTKRDKLIKRRDITIEHLINAYRVLTNEISHRSNYDEKKLEDILSDIQLFGSIEQVELAKALADTVAKREEFPLDILINSLRDDLRKQLELKRVKGNVKWLRFNKK